MYPPGTVTPPASYHFPHQKLQEHSRHALDIGHSVQNWKVPTTIAFGKYAISLLYEANDLVLRKGFSISQVYIAVGEPAAILYSSQNQYTGVFETQLQENSWPTRVTKLDACQDLRGCRIGTVCHKKEAAKDATAAMTEAVAVESVAITSADNTGYVDNVASPGYIYMRINRCPPF